MAEKKDKKKRARKGRRILRLFYWAFWLCFLFAVSGLIGLMGGYYYFSRDLPLISSLHSYRPPIVTQVYADDGTLISEHAEQRRKLVPKDEIPEVVKKTFLAAEDHRFLEHSGVDWHGVAGAFWYDIRHPDDIMRGASTITMQVARTFFLSRDRTWERKIKEAILAVRIEQQLSKEDILYLYLNQVDFGRGCYGIGAASEYYFGKPAQELTMAESAMLAGILPAPSVRNPVSSFNKAKKAQWRVLFLNMIKDAHMIDEAEAEEAYNEVIYVAGSRGPQGELCPYFAEYVRRELIERYGEETVMREGLQVFTSVNLNADRVAGEALKERILAPDGIDKALGYRGPLKADPMAGDTLEAFQTKAEKNLRKYWARRVRKQALQDGQGGDPGKQFNVLMETGPDPAPLLIDNNYKGVVTKVSDSPAEVRVSIGHSEGVIELKDMKWAGKYNPRTYPPVRLKRPSNILKEGQLVLVRTIEKVEDEEGGSWYRLALEQNNIIEGGLISLSTRTGHVKALRGGADFKKSQFIRPIQASRQPGSAFKPIIYSAAMDDPMGRYTPATIIFDAPIIFEDDTRNPNCPEEVKIWEKYTPKNYNMTFSGPQTIRHALAKSINTVAVRVSWNMCLPYTLEYAHKLGIESDLDMLPCLPLGCSEVTLEELARAYNVFASGGYLIDPGYIVRVYDRDGNLLEYEEDWWPPPDHDPETSEGGTAEASPGDIPAAFPEGAGGEDLFEEDLEADTPRPTVGTGGVHHYVLSRPAKPEEIGEKTLGQYRSGLMEKGRDWLPPISVPAYGSTVISPQTAYIMNSMLKSVVKWGTATRANKLRRPVAGKTGTTNNYRDALFAGYSPELLAAVWVGADDYSYGLGKGMSGGKAALPIWVRYMEEVLDGREKVDFPVPAGVTWVTVDTSTGLRAAECSKPENVVTEVYKKDMAPEGVTPCEGGDFYPSYDGIRDLDR